MEDNLKDDEKIKKKKKKKNIIIWPIKIGLITLIMSLILSISSEFLLSNAGIFVSIIILFLMISISIIFDIIGVATTSASIEPFLAMASRKEKGANSAIKFVKNAEKISNFCCDVVGDMCNILSGAVGAALVIKIIQSAGLDSATIIIASAISSFVACITVFGKALGKGFAIKNSNKIVLFASKFIRNKD